VVDSTGLVATVASGEAVGLTFSVFCSQAASNAAAAKMQMYFFIGLELEMHVRINHSAQQGSFSVLIGRSKRRRVFEPVRVSNCPAG